MPWKVVGNRVVKATTGKTIKGGSHGSHAQALRHLRAIYANVHEKAFEPHHGKSGSVQLRGRHGVFTQMVKKKLHARMAKPIAMMVKAFDPGQKRWGKGSPKGGQWRSSVSGEIFTGGKQGIARDVIRSAERLHGPLPKHTVRLTRRLGPGIEGAVASDGRIYISARSPIAALETAHELGHLLDHRRFGSAYPSVDGAAFKNWRRAVDRSGKVKQWRSWNALGHIALGGNRYMVGRGVFRYALNRKEQFARAYAQYLARKTGGRLRSHLRIAQKSPVSYYWKDNDFRGIEREMDKLFR